MLLSSAAQWSVWCVSTPTDLQQESGVGEWEAEAGGGVGREKRIDKQSLGIAELAKSLFT